MARSVSVYLRHGWYYVHGNNRCDSGPWIACAPFLCASAAVADAVIGELIVAALEQGAAAEPPDDWLGAFAPLLRCARASTIEAFVVGASACGVSERVDGFTVSVAGSSLLICRAAGPIELGAAVRTALAMTPAVRRAST